jgi:PAS domain S-box-containing protein
VQNQDITGAFKQKKAELQAVLDAAVFQVLRPGSLLLGGLYVVFTAAHWLTLPEPAKRPMTMIALASAIVLVIFFFWLGRAAPPTRWAHPLVAGLAGIVLANSLAHIYFTAAPKQTINLVMLVIGTSCIFLSIRWLALILTLVFVGWWWVAWLVVRPGMASLIDFELCSATFLAVIIHTLRLRTYTHLEELRRRDEHRNRELEAALASAEREINERKRAEADLQTARAELEKRVQERTRELAQANEALLAEIVERVRAETALRKSEAGLMLAQRIGRVGSWELDLRTNALYWSPESFRIFGRDPASFLPSRESFLEAVHPEDRMAIRQAFEKALRQAEVYSIDHRLVLPDGSERIVCERAELILDSNGTPVQLVGTVQDITERKQLEAQLRHSQKMDAIGQLAAGVAHDFNNLLTVIQGHGSLLRDLTGDDAEKNELAMEVVEAAERATLLTRQLMLLSRKQILKTDRLDLNAATRSLTRLLGRILREDIALEFEHTANLPAIEADQGMIEQVVMNLAVNARDAMPRGGRLSIRTAAVFVDAARAQKNPEARVGQFVRLTVTDTGCGIDPASLPRIFEPFFTTKPVGKGTGLGLSTVYGIVQQHGGWVEVSSELNRGTSFNIYFPVSSPQAIEAKPASSAALETKPAPPSVPGGTERILVVEDEPAVRQLACRLLRRHGYEVFEAESGRAALPVWAQHGPRIDLLLTDLVMPGGLSGRELAQRLLSQKPGLKVIYTSGYSTDFDTLESSLGDGIYFLPKPYQFPTLARLVRECLDR